MGFGAICKKVFVLVTTSNMAVLWNPGLDHRNVKYIELQAQINTKKCDGLLRILICKYMEHLSDIN